MQVELNKANLWHHVASKNLPDSQLCLESKTEPSVTKWGDTALKNWKGETAQSLLRWGHRTYLIEVGTLHIPYWGGDTAHALLGWGHRTTLKEISLSTKFQVCSALPSDG